MLYIIATVALIAIDRAVKILVKANIPLGESVELLPGILRLTHVENYGAAFNIFSGGRWPLIIITSLILIAAIIILSKGIIKNSFGRWSTTFVIAGAVGNLIDRVLYGMVVDMFEFEFIRFAVFNVADIFIVCGGIAVCIYVFFMHDKKPSAKELNINEDNS